MADPFMGELRLLGFNFAPRGWAQCNGQLMSISQNSALFALLGTLHATGSETWRERLGCCLRFFGFFSRQLWQAKRQ